MSGQLIPPPELAPPVPEHLTAEQRIALWADLMDACEQFLLAGLRTHVGSEGDLKAAYQRWYSERMEEHDRTMEDMVRKFNRRGGDHGL